MTSKPFPSPPELTCGCGCGAPAWINSAVPNGHRVCAALAQFTSGVHFVADRLAAGALEQLAPGVGRAVRDGYRFKAAAVRQLLDLGFEQFLDLGCGWPHQEDTVHLLAELRPQARVLTVARDLSVASTARALFDTYLKTTATAHTRCLTPDVLSHPTAVHLFDPARPIAVLLVSTPHEEPLADLAGLIRDLTARLAPGSAVVLSQWTATSPELCRAVGDFMAEQTQGGEWGAVRSPDEVGAVLAGLDLLGTGPGPVADWDTTRSPWPPERTARTPPLLTEYGAVALTGSTEPAPTEEN